MRKVIELHDKFMAYVNDCFLNHTLFHKVRNSKTHMSSYALCCCSICRSQFYLIVYALIHRLSRRHLKFSATRELLEALAPNFWLHFAITFSKKEEVKN